MDFWVKRMPDTLRLVPETTFYINDDTFLEPDFVFYRKSDGLVNLKPATALLAVEVSDSSLGYDLGRKSLLYAVHGIRQVWIIDAVKLETHIRRRPGLEGYTEKLLVPPDAELVPDFAAELAVKLGELELV